jgi:hypothetical protein
MKWVKPSGVEIETRDTEEIIEYCESLGWKRKTSRRPKKEAKDSPTTETAGGE